jgi:hypothetical protein
MHLKFYFSYYNAAHLTFAFGIDFHEFLLI